MIETPDDDAAVAVCRYPPQGRRSVGPIRVRMHDGRDESGIRIAPGDEIVCEFDQGLGRVDISFV